ncbi:MAG TPA: methyltransferase domain-containing protein [Solirubrobacteraceae bacterium]|jgi:trans-aconitate 2-methyltransferase|nr:methyltransferase domain-containing protein [Solirubrobacteraceae bacterium]
MRWDPSQYARYSDHRARPFFDLAGQIGAPAPAAVLDVGCGSGELTATLAERWPDARVSGVDSSPEMIERAPRDARVSFSVGEATTVSAVGVDVLVTNAMLQWVPGHDGLLQRWAEELNPDGWLALQVPSNFGAPSHVLMRRLAESPRWRDRLHGVLRGTESVLSAAEYLDLLAGRGMHVDAWQTEYQHVLQGPDPVLEWVRGTGLRPVLAALGDDEAAEFSAEYAALLRDAYAPRSYGTVLGFLRTFAVAHKP